MSKVDQVMQDGHMVLKQLLEAVSRKEVKLRKHAFRYLKGLVLLQSTKGAALVGYESGHGVAFKVLEFSSDGNPQKLSGPVPMKLTKLTIGLQLGYNNVYTVIAIFDFDTIDAMVSRSEGVIAGKDFEMGGLLLQGTEAVPHESSMCSLDDPLENAVEKARIITVSDSYMVLDLSLYGGSLKVDLDLLKEAYGEVEPLDVLHGRAPISAKLRQDIGPIKTDLNQLVALTMK